MSPVCLPAKSTNFVAGKQLLIESRGVGVRIQVYNWDRKRPDTLRITCHSLLPTVVEREARLLFLLEKRITQQRILFPQLTFMVSGTLFAVREIILQKRIYCNSYWCVCGLGTQCTATGFGDTSYRGPAASKLQQVQVPTKSLDYCKRQYSTLVRWFIDWLMVYLFIYTFCFSLSEIKLSFNIRVGVISFDERLKNHLNYFSIH